MNNENPTELPADADPASAHVVVTSVPVEKAELEKLRRKAGKSIERLHQIKLLRDRLDEVEKKIAELDEYETSVTYCIESATALIGAAETLVKMREPVVNGVE